MKIQKIASTYKSLHLLNLSLVRSVPAAGSMALGGKKVIPSLSRRR